jgi:hypothetical protein
VQPSVDIVVAQHPRNLGHVEIAYENAQPETIN